MAFEGLTDKLQNAFRKLNSKGKLTEADVKAAMREVRMALLEADVNFLVVKDLFDCKHAYNVFYCAKLRIYFEFHIT